MMKKLLATGMVLLLAACNTPVPLNDVPVSDAKSTTVSPAAAGGAGSGSSSAASGKSVGSGGVASVDLNKNQNQANANSPAAMPLQARTVYFDFDSYVIKPEFQTLLANHARILRAQPANKVAIEGHTDESGGREYNLALGQKRADAVRDALTILGVQKSQMESVSFGKEKPAVMGTDEAAYAKNRRAEIRYQ